MKKNELELTKLKQELIESALNNEPMVIEAKGKGLSVRFYDKDPITPPFDFKNQSHGLKFFSFSKIFFKEYQSIEDKTDKSFYLKDFKDYNHLINFLNENDYFYIGVDINLSHKVTLKETKFYPNLGYIYVDKKHLMKFFNIQDLENSYFKEHTSQFFIPSLEGFLNGEVFELFIQDKESQRVKVCFGIKGAEALIDIELAS